MDADVYAVGWLAVLLGLGRAVRARHPRAVAFAFDKAWQEWRFVVRAARAGRWREVRNTFNGYLAEMTPCLGSRCGHGWTRRRALRDLYRHTDETLGLR